MQHDDAQYDNLPLPTCDAPDCGERFHPSEGAVGPDFSFCAKHMTNGVLRTG